MAQLTASNLAKAYRGREVVQDEFAGGQTKRSHLRFVFNWFNDLDSKVRRDKP